MPLLQEAGITPTTPDFFNSLPIGNVGDGDESQIGMTMNNCKKLQKFLEENPDRAPAGVVWPERPNPEDSPLVRPDPVQPSQDMIDAQDREREREYGEDDFEDPCEGVKCDPGEKCVDGDCVEDDYSDESFERPDARDLPSIPGQTDGDEDADIICGGDADCPDNKPKCFNGRCVKEAFQPQTPKW